MREIRTSGSEGGAVLTPRSYLYLESRAFRQRNAECGSEYAERGFARGGAGVSSMRGGS